ncbi:MAG: NADH-quinone oxidoreductase subunit [Solirubrobacterales bacterium]|nr:NADH-quinone oxidoreductase subunit [Solirubrobacterales bacterium]
MSSEELQPAHLMEPTDDLTADERKRLIASMRPSDAEGVPELHEVDIPDDLREEIEEMMSRYPQLRSASIPALWAIQRHYGWCTPDGIRQAAAVMGVTPAYLESVASFYDLFATQPVGTHRVLVCTNISCWMRGGDQLLESFCEATGADHHEAAHQGASSADGEFYVKGFECLGACDLAPMASIDARYYGPLDAADAVAAIEALRAGDPPPDSKALSRRPAAGGDEPAPDPRLEGTDVA